jgi:nucleoside phosphorylase
MTRTAIIAAMPAELKPLVRRWQHTRQNGVDLWRWSFVDEQGDGGEWIAACAGAGVDAATRAFAEVEKSGEISRLISIGWAGALREEIVPGKAYDVSCVIDARSGARFLTKSHPGRKNKDAALAVEGMQIAAESIPQGLKPDDPEDAHTARLKSCPDASSPSVNFQCESQDDRYLRPQKRDLGHPDLWLVTNPKVADHAEKQRLAATYQAALVEMEAAAIARLAQMRGIPFYCIKGISDGFSDNLPDFNHFISTSGQFQLGHFIVHVLLRPGYWPSLIRMGENSRKAARNLAASVLDLIDERGTIRNLNDYPRQKR